jgi:hypothetical protein
MSEKSESESEQVAKVELYSEERYLEFKRNFLLLKDQILNMFNAMRVIYERSGEIIESCSRGRLAAAKYIKELGGDPNRTFEEAYDDALFIIINEFMDYYEQGGIEYVAEMMGVSWEIEFKKSDRFKEITNFFVEGFKLEDMIKAIEDFHNYLEVLLNQELPEIIEQYKQYKEQKSDFPLTLYYDSWVVMYIGFEKILEILKAEMDRRKITKDFEI